MAYGFSHNPITNYFRTTYQELSRVVWPTRDQVVKHTLLVIAGSIGIAIFFGIVDFIFSAALQKLIERF